jgi:hypothetical protein
MILRAARLFLYAAAAGVLSGCVSSRHLVFFTNTTIGVEIAAEPNATTPAKFIIGYKRAEGVIDPLGEGQVAESNEGKHPIQIGGSPKALLKPEGHSVLAKLNFGAGGGGANSTTTQWFATGEAAKIIAQAPGIAGAVTGSPEIAKAAAEEARVSIRNTAPDRLSELAQLKIIYEQLTGQKATVKAAAVALAKMDAIDVSAQAPAFNWYEAPATAWLKLSPQPALAGGHTFPNATTYLARLSESVEALRKNIDPVAIELKMNDPAVAASAGFIRQAQEDYAKQKDLLAKLQKRMAEDTGLIAAVEYYAGSLISRSKPAQP